jgi:hypothetical protein
VLQGMLALVEALFLVALQGLLAVLLLPIFCVMYAVSKWWWMEFCTACAWTARLGARVLLWVMDITVPQPAIDLWRSWVARRLRVIVVFPHTSLWDSFLQIVISVAYDLPGFAVAHACWEHHWIVGPFLRLCGGGGGGGILFVQPHVDGGQGGATRQITSQLLQATRNGASEGLLGGFVFWISPTGGRVPREWRSGFYHVGLATGASFAVGGIDYETRTFCLHPELVNPRRLLERDRSIEQVTKDLVPRFCSITPLNPLLSFPPPSRHLKCMPTVVPNWVLCDLAASVALLALGLLSYCLWKSFDALSCLGGPL